MSARSGGDGSERAGAARSGGAPGGAPRPEGSADDEIEILEVVGVDETGAAAPDRFGAPAESSVAPAGPSQADLDQAVREKERYHDLWLRQQAEFDNFRKRAERDVERQRANAAADLLRSLLPVLDSLERALRSSAGDDPMRRGVELIHQQMLESLAKEGLEVIATLGERFDPALHEAVEVLDAEGCEQGVIVEEMQKGFVYKERLIRPALVKVSSGRGRTAGARTAD
jgi:molecular chaperone GrpE